MRYRSPAINVSTPRREQERKARCRLGSERAHFALVCGAKRVLLSSFGRAASHQIDKLRTSRTRANKLRPRRGHPVGALLATSCGGGGSAADLDSRVSRPALREARVHFARNHPVRALRVSLRAAADPCTDRAGHVTRVLAASHG